MLLILAAPAAAQDRAGIDVDAIGVRAEAFADARDYEARVAELCAAGDRDGTAAFAAEVEANFYAQDAEAGGMRACLVEVLGRADLGADHVCDR